MRHPRMKGGDKCFCLELVFSHSLQIIQCLRGSHFNRVEQVKPMDVDNFLRRAKEAARTRSSAWRHRLISYTVCARGVPTPRIEHKLIGLHPNLERMQPQSQQTLADLCEPRRILLNL